MKTYYLFLAGCLPLLLFGQDKTHFFSGHLSVGTGYYSINAADNLFAQQFTPKLTTGLEWNYNYGFKPRWRLLTGMAYSKTKSILISS